jgi:hypothetical protein
MRRDKTFARILLIFSIAHVVLAAPAVVRQRGLVPNVPDNELTDEPVPSLETAPDVSETSPPPSQAASLHEPSVGLEQGSAPGSPAGSSHQDGVELAAPPTQPAGSHQDWTPSHGPSSDVPLSQDLASSHDAEFTPLSGSPESHYAPLVPHYSPPTPGTSSLHDDSLARPGVQPSGLESVPLGDSPPSGSGVQPSRWDDSPPSVASGSGVQPLSKDPPWWQNIAIEQASPSGLSSFHSEPGATLLHDDLSSGSEAQPLSKDPPWWQNFDHVSEIEEGSPLHSEPGALGAASLHDNLPSGSGPQPLFKDPPWWQNFDHVSEIEEGSPLHSEPGALGALGAASLHDNLPSGSGPQPLFKDPPWWLNYGLDAEAEAKEAADKVKPPKGLCGLRCWMRSYPRSFKSSPERDHGHRFSWDVSFSPTPPASKPTHNLTYDLSQ